LYCKMLKTISRGTTLQASLQRCFTASAARPGEHQPARLLACKLLSLWVYHDA
jgi:hypothetical protein